MRSRYARGPRAAAATCVESGGLSRGQATVPGSDHPSSPKTINSFGGQSTCPSSAMVHASPHLCDTAPTTLNKGERLKPGVGGSAKPLSRREYLSACVP